LNAKEGEANELVEYSQRLTEQVEQLALSERGLDEQLSRRDAEARRTRAQLDDLEAVVCQSLTALSGKSKSQQAKELVRRWEARGTGTEGLLEWLRSSQGVLSATLLKAELLETEVQVAAERVSTVSCHLADLQATEHTQRERERDFRSQVEQLIYQRDHSEAERATLEREVTALRNEVQQRHRESSL
jgi:chromosome segregation ATPase